MESTHVHTVTAPFRAYTVVELLVVLAIIGILSIIVINGQNDFNRSLTITDSAYTVALSLREAQTFGLSSRTFGNTNKAGYGAHFSFATPTSYFIFSDLHNGGNQPSWCPTTHARLPDDKPGDCLYSSPTEVFQNFTLGRGFTITKICGHDFQSPGTNHCSTDSTGPITALDMVFLRPNTDSVITAILGGNAYRQLSDASIILSAPNNAGSRLICISYAGQVSVATSTCPQ